MKRIMILPAVALTICLALPQFSQATMLQNEVAATQQKDIKYTEVTADQLPQGVSKALARDYTGFKTEKVFKGDDGSFKVKISQGDDKSVLFYSENGDLIKSQKASDKAKSEKADSEKTNHEKRNPENATPEKQNPETPEKREDLSPIYRTNTLE